jgi:hypothetical protein
MGQFRFYRSRARGDVLGPVQLSVSYRAESLGFGDRRMETSSEGIYPGNRGLEGNHGGKFENTRLGDLEKHIKTEVLWQTEL